MSELRDDPLSDLPLRGMDEDPPFLRTRVRASRRRAHRGALGRLLTLVQVAGGLVVSVAVLALGYDRVMASERLKVAQVDVKGSRFLSEGEVRGLLGPAVGENILGLDIASLQNRLLSSPWVSVASVRRTLPDTLQVEIRERVPLALAELDRLYLMDAEGTLIDIYGPRTSGFDLPIVRGLSGSTGEARRARVEKAGALLADLGELASEISEVEVEEQGDLKVALKGAGEVLRLGSPPYRERVATFLALRAEMRERAPKAEYFDLRFRDRIYAKQPPEPEPKAPVKAARELSPRPTAPAAPRPSFTVRATPAPTVAAAPGTGPSPTTSSPASPALAGPEASPTPESPERDRR